MQWKESSLSLLSEGGERSGGYVCSDMHLHTWNPSGSLSFLDTEMWD